MAEVPKIPLNARGQDPKENRALDTRRDNDSFRTPSVSFYDIDYAIYHYLSRVVIPPVEENGELISVPIFRANGETTAQLQRHGYLNDKNEKAITPILLISKNNSSRDDNIPTSEIPTDFFQNGPIIIPKIQNNNQFDRIEDTYNTKPSIEYYVSVFPKHVIIDYTINIWTEFEPQMNTIVQSLMSHDKMLWGDVLKFTTRVSDFSHETINTFNEERIVRSTGDISVKGIIQDEFLGKKSAVRKAYTTKRVDFTNEREQPELYVSDSPREIRPDANYIRKLKGANG